MLKEKEFDIESMLTLAMDIGKSMIKCGSEISRVEETIIRICHAYGMKQTDVFSIISMMHVTTIDENGKIERMERVGLGNTLPEFYEKASTLYGEQKSEITCGSITWWACNWWKFVIVLIDLAIDWI